MRRLLFIAALASAASACGDVSGVRQTSSRAAALGEPLGEYPSYEERLLLYFTNRARTAPTDLNPDDPYPPSRPLQFDLGLNKAARFHAQHIIEASCWCEDHSSCCELTGTGDDVTCGGPTTGCGAMSADERVSLFSPAYSGENMAMGQPSAAEAMLGWAYSPGHWQNINNPAASLLGAGNYENAWVQDFGAGGPTAPPIGDGIHFGDGQRTRFGITYAQANTGGPQTALVIVDGECHALDLVHGTAELGAFEVAVNLEPGCHRYYFHFTDGNGNDLTYPSFGSFGAGVGESCPFFIDTRPADTCSPSGQTCTTGDTRHCYTGPFGTEGVGACLAGSERCVSGQWTGECRLEVHPTEDVCGNAVDDDCDGEVDEQCPSGEDVGASDAGFDDVGALDDEPPKATNADGGCATARTPGHTSSLIWMLAAVLGRRRLRRRV